MYGILLRQISFVMAVECSRSCDFYMADVNQLLLVNEITLISLDNYFKTVF